MPERIFLSPPQVGATELALLNEAFASNYIAPVGPMIERFEHEFATLTGVGHAVAVASGTAALHLALRLLELGAGDRIYCPSLTFIGGIAPVLYEGAVPVFIDSDATSWTLDVNLLAEMLAKDHARNQLPKAVVPTDIYGQSCDLDAILEICAPYGIPVVTDSAEAVGTRYKNRHAGKGALMAAYSFNGNKIITTSGGGMLVSDDKSLIERARFLSQQAKDPAPHYEHTTYGYNYRLSNLAAAIGCGQLTSLAEKVARRRAIFTTYRRELSDIPGIEFMPEAAYGQCTHWLSVITIDSAIAPFSNESLRQILEAEAIESRPVWKPMHMQPLFANAEMVGGNVAERLFASGLCLPSGSALTEDQQARIISIIRHAVT